MKVKTKVIIITLIPLLIIGAWFFSDFRRNAFRYFNIGLYGTDCGRYGRCASFKTIAEAEEISLKIRCLGDDMMRESSNNIYSLYCKKYCNNWTGGQIPNNRSVILNASGVVMIGGEIYTYLYGNEYGSKEGRNKIE